MSRRRSCYEPSPRSLPRRLPALEYPGHCEVRFVGSNGCVSWKGAPQFVASALAGEYVAFEEVDDGIWTLSFATVALARYDERHRTFRPLPIAVNGGRSAGFASSAPDLKSRKTNDHKPQ